jgi:sugar diacid utilization regulator
MSEALGADDAVLTAQRAVAAAALVHPELGDVERLLSQLVDGTTDPRLGAFVRLLDGSTSEDDAAQLDMPLTGARLVVARYDDARTGSALLALLARERDALAVVHCGSLVALARNVPHRAGDDKGLRMATRLGVLVGRQAPDVRVGISSSVDAAVDVAQALRDAADAAGLAAPGGWVCVDDVWAEVVVARVRKLLPDCMTARHPLARLVAHDRRHGSGLARTVAIWLDRQRDTAVTADELLVHPNTLRYRLRRAQTVSGLDLDVTSQALVAHLLLAWSTSTGRS